MVPCAELTLDVKRHRKGSRTHLNKQTDRINAADAMHFSWTKHTQVHVN